MKSPPSDFYKVHNLAVQKQAYWEGTNQTKKATETFQVAVNTSILHRRPWQISEFHVFSLGFIFPRCIFLSHFY